MRKWLRLGWRAACALPCIGVPLALVVICWQEGSWLGVAAAAVALAQGGQLARDVW